jgi:hypothetical protein
VIGEWVPIGAEGLESEIVLESKMWVHGLRWEEIGLALRLHHRASNGGEIIRRNLLDVPQVLAVLKNTYPYAFLGGQFNREALPLTGPVIVDEKYARPYFPHRFRRVWREVADAAGVPRGVKNRDSRMSDGSDSEDEDAAN